MALFSPALKFLCIGNFEETFVLGLYNYTDCIWLCQEVHTWLGEQFMVHMCVSLRKFLHKTKSRAYLAVLQDKVLHLYVRGFVWTGILWLHTLVSQELLPGSLPFSLFLCKARLYMTFSLSWTQAFPRWQACCYNVYYIPFRNTKQNWKRILTSFSIFDKLSQSWCCWNCKHRNNISLQEFSFVRSNRWHEQNESPASLVFTLCLKEWGAS